MTISRSIRISVLAGTLLSVGAMTAPITVQAKTEVPVGQMEKYCQGEASAEFDTRPNYITTFRVEQRGKGHVVRGEVPTHGSYSTTFECLFDRHNGYSGIEVTGGADNSGHGSSGRAVSVSQMQKYCQGEASAEFDVRPNYITTEAVEQTRRGHLVRGEAEVGENSYTKFECAFNQQDEFQGVHVIGGQHHGGSHNSGGHHSDQITRAARERCVDMFGNSPEVTNVSALRPGYWEVIMQARNGSRSAACTVTDNGEIEDWVELN